jgi:hypothetical protein
MLDQGAADIALAGRGAVWIDFGMRYEMFNHLGVDPAMFPAEGSIIGILRSNSGRITDHLLTYEDVVAKCGSIAERLGNDSPDGYREAIAAFLSAHAPIYVLPLFTPKYQIGGTSRDITSVEISNVIRDVIAASNPAFLFMTFEGQPELEVFTAHFPNDHLLQWALSVADLVISMVRFDSRERFLDSVAIPEFLSQVPGLQPRLRIVPTRATRHPMIGGQGGEYVLGTLPLAAFIGFSVNAGRIPYIDASIHPHQWDAAGSEHRRYYDAITSLAQSLLQQLYKPEDDTDEDCSGNQLHQP